MKQLIIYPNSEGGITILNPTGELPIEDVAQKDVPAGVPFKYITESDLPEDRYFRNAWESDFSEPDGHGIGYDAWKELQDAKVQEMTDDNN